jgi:hypothetical protein
VLYLMNSSDDKRLSGGMAGLNVADAGGGGDAAVSAVSAPQGTQVPGGAHLSAAGGSKGGESVVAVSAPVVTQITSREVIRAAGARLAVLSAERAASAAHLLPVPPEVDMHDGSAEMPARQSFNRQWLNVVISYAKDRKYDGNSAADSLPVLQVICRGCDSCVPGPAF